MGACRQHDGASFLRQSPRGCTEHISISSRFIFVLPLNLLSTWQTFTLFVVAEGTTTTEFALGSLCQAQIPIIHSLTLESARPIWKPSFSVGKVARTGARFYHNKDCDWWVVLKRVYGVGLAGLREAEVHAAQQVNRSLVRRETSWGLVDMERNGGRLVQGKMVWREGLLTNTEYHRSDRQIDVPSTVGRGG